LKKAPRNRGLFLFAKPALGRLGWSTYAPGPLFAPPLLNFAIGLMVVERIFERHFIDSFITMVIISSTTNPK